MKNDTTKESISSSSSVKTEPSKPWTEVAHLGQRIIHELGIHKGNSVLERWMAQRVSELISKTETATDDTAREIAAKECEELVMKLWSIRNSFPSGGPFSSIMPTLKRLLGERDLYYRVPFGKDPDEGGLISQIIRLHEREMLIFLDAPNIAISQEIFEASQQIREHFFDELDEFERNVLLFVARNKSHVNSETEHDTEQPSDNKSEDILNKTNDSFERIASDRKEIIRKAFGENLTEDYPS